MQRKILIIYTGGTIGMIKNPITGSLTPFNFEALNKHIPALDNFNCQIDSYSFNPLIDSSDMEPSNWTLIAQVIETQYDKYDGFVILHGTDTMAFTASALSFMLENLSKPVVLTGSQLPIGVQRTDGRENIINAIEIASAYKDGKAIIPEVTVCFENKIMRGNRTTKYTAEDFNAFISGNFPFLAEVGVHIKYNETIILKPDKNNLIVRKELDNNIALLKLYPGIKPEIIENIINLKGLKGLVLETYGSGNAPTKEWFLNLLKRATEQEIIIYNVSQCLSGAVEMGKYEASNELLSIGVVSGSDITTESALTKMMYLFGQNLSKMEIKQQLRKSLRGEQNT